MNAFETTSIRGLLITALVGLLMACGGGGGGNGADISFGTVTDFGSIILNNSHLDDSSASVTLDGKPGTGTPLRPGMVIAIEPMVNLGDWRTKRDDDEWTVRTIDGELSAHFEHTLAITDGEAEVLTLP